MASLSVNVADLVLSVAVTAANTATAVLANNTGGAVDLGSATLRVRVIPFDVI
jgi:D-alanyl-D-alanine carboxypeptidase